jgi:hypothetical protein
MLAAAKRIVIRSPQTTDVAITFPSARHSSNRNAIWHPLRVFAAGSYGGRASAGRGAKLRARRLIPTRFSRRRLHVGGALVLFADRWPRCDVARLPTAAQLGDVGSMHRRDAV